MQRLLLGLIALIMLAVGLAPNFSNVPEFWAESIAPMALRVSILLGVLWLALPQVIELMSRFSPTALVGIVASGVVLLVRPKLVIYVVPILAALFAFQFLTNLFREPRRSRKKTD